MTGVRFLLPAPNPAAPQSADTPDWKRGETGKRRALRLEAQLMPIPQVPYDEPGKPPRRER
jgi:hypothetical protein